jgi:hypothetical protein
MKKLLLSKLFRTDIRELPFGCFEKDVQMTFENNGPSIQRKTDLQFIFIFDICEFSFNIICFPRPYWQWYFGRRNVQGSYVLSNNEMN